MLNREMIDYSGVQRHSSIASNKSALFERGMDFKV